MLLYEVNAKCDNAATADEWVRWMRVKHLRDVVDAGAMSGRVLQVDGTAHAFVAQYEFVSRGELEKYLAHHAPRLRAEGLEKFGERIQYTRRVSELIG
ncbi:hypothetical protein RAS2_23170 [Phycisphaerae bacterium RAS2]|nr:hypothetical protein RAS2_23170 [Phycisphaerae bacterium RAS2]